VFVGVVGMIGTTVLAVLAAMEGAPFLRYSFLACTASGRPVIADR
jgi:hypothetical protein